MARHRVGLVLLFLIAGVDAGDEMTEAVRRDRVSRLRARAATWHAARKGLVTKCGACHGVGTVTERGPVNRGGLATGEVVTCSRCNGDTKAVQEAPYRRAFFEMMTPAHRSVPDRAEAFERELEAAVEGRRWPSIVEKWQIDRVELVDATHGVVWARLNGERDQTPMRWIRVDDTNGKPDWFVYDVGTDGAWPGGWEEPGAPPGIAEIDWMEWLRRAAEVRAQKATTLAKVETLKAEAAKILVVETVKIVDVAPSGEGAKVTVCRLFGGPWRTSVEVGKEDLPLVREWGKWDRLTWRLRVVVEGVQDSDMHGEILWYGPDSIVWEKNPGLEGHEIDPADPPSFREWCAKFDAAEPAARLAMIKQVQGKAFVDEATVLDRTADEAKAQFEGAEPVTFPLHDPQVADELEVGDTIVVARWADTMDVVEGDASREKLRFAYAVLKRTPAAE